MPNIFLMMDDDGDQSHAVHILAKYHFVNSIFKVNRPRDALKFFSQLNSPANGSSIGLPELIILSLEGPHQMDVVLASRKGRLSDVPLVVVAGSREEEEGLRTLNLPRSYCMGKPLGFFKLLEAMQKLGMFWLILRSSPSQAM